MYYVFGKGDMTRACIHMGHYHHPVSQGICKESKVEIDDLIGREVERTPTATNFAIALAASKEFLAKYLLCTGDDPNKVMDLESIKFVMDMYQYLNTPSIRNTVTSFKRIGRGGSLTESPDSEVITVGPMCKKTNSQAKESCWRKSMYSRCSRWALALELTSSGECNHTVICKMLGSCLTMSSMSRGGQPWLAMSMTRPPAGL
jgi:hypothetical protein